MKRQRGVNVNGVVKPMNNPPKIEEVAAAMGKKKAKREGDINILKVEEKEEKKENRDMGAGDSHVAHHAMGCINWEEHMPWLGGVVDEQMSWGSTWFPGWDIDFMGEAFTALYSDVVWDDDIWNLKNQIPIQR